MDKTRRTFIKKTSLGSLALGTSCISTSAFAIQKHNKEKNKGLTILFQGDSITDGNRTRNEDWNHIMGHGYAYLIASKLWYQFTQENLHFINRGISGNTINDLENRWQKDTLNLQPDVLSILVGINDVNTVVDGKNPQSIETFKDTYSRLLEKTKKELPKTKIILMEPFLLPLGRVDNKPEVWKEETQKRSEVVRELVNTFDTGFVALQQPFIEKCKVAPPEYWIWDGIHPMPAGHELIAQLWLEEAKKFLPFI